MPSQDTSQLKEKIIVILKRRGPSLPVHIAGETGLSILFASAFLSELVSERKTKISNMRIGSSPVYFLPNQEYLLEKFSHHLKSKEKDAYMLLKEKKFLNDSRQDPAIRVALREIKDFAIPFKKNEEIFWRYYTVPESEFKLKESKPQKDKVIKQDIKIPQLIQSSLEGGREGILQSIASAREPRPKELNIFDKETEKPKAKKLIKKKPSKKKTPQKKNDKFFNKVKEFLIDKSVEIVDIESFNKNDLILRIRIKGKEELLIAYNKKRINEDDIIKASKKSQELNLPYRLLSQGEPIKKINNLIEAVKNLSAIEKL